MLKKLCLITAVTIIACDGDSVNPFPNPTVTLSPDSITILVGGSANFTSTVTNWTGSVQFVTRNEAIAQITSPGVVTGMAQGETYIVASIDAANARDSVRVRVTPSGGQTLILPLLGTGSVTERYTGEVAARGNVAYTATWASRSVGNTITLGNAIKVWDLSGNQPVLVDSLIVDGAGTVSDVQISDDGQLLVASLENGLSGNNGLAIYNRADPLHPTLARRYTNSNMASGVHTVKLGRIGGRLYAFCSAGNSGQLTIVDITDPATASQVYSASIASTIHDVFVRDGILFTAIWHIGLRIYDVGGAGRGGSPSAPLPLATIKTANCSECGSGTSSVHNVWWFHDPTTNAKRYAFVGEEGPSSLFSSSRGAMHVVEMSADFTTLREVAVYEPDPATSATGLVAGAHNFVMDEPSGILYAAFYNGGVRALDVRGDLSVCAQAQKTADGRCDLRLMGREVGVAVSSGPPKFIWGVAMVGNHLYASDMPVGLHKIDISGLKR